MRIQFILTFLTPFLFFFPATGQSQTQTPSSFDEQVRQVLLRNPEIILEVFAILEDQQRVETSASDQQIIEQFSNELFGDNADASHSILVEFSDYQCGYCRQSAPVVASILAENPEITLRLIELPILGEKSREYAAKMLAIRSLYGEETYMELHRLFLGGRGGELQNFDAVIAERGLSPQRVYEVANTDPIQETIAANLALADAMGIGGTPGFVTRTDIIRGFVQKPVLLEALSGS
ncbi:MAG: DsbA family protein [Rhodobacteraceae bacterium]|nr:DsbA family protein [Paracoccaceae bacterium]